jgi:hypothetical protein
MQSLSAMAWQGRTTTERAHMVRSLVGRCLNGQAAKMTKFGISNAELLVAISSSLTGQLQTGKHELAKKTYRFYRRIHGHQWQAFHRQLAPILIEEVRASVGQIGFSEPGSPLQRLDQIMRRYDWRLRDFGVDYAEEMRWNSQHFMDVDFLYASDMHDDFMRDLDGGETEPSYY